MLFVFVSVEAESIQQLSVLIELRDAKETCAEPARVLETHRFEQTKILTHITLHFREQCHNSEPTPPALLESTVQVPTSGKKHQAIMRHLSC